MQQLLVFYLGLFVFVVAASLAWGTWWLAGSGEPTQELHPDREAQDDYDMDMNEARLAAEVARRHQAEKVIVTEVSF